ncbi:hypothetical protein SAMD00019534_022310 [Acytostelium subglobosum LB1]|uniref:hypothetical protein n=1 Tax=Acytostelium subglobosum LB1 TaxID=1410327 RepID=UPI000644DB49|nr:hypothetical protein SAMD00019534_022310 [Acytostelium subglobosum LB1]GAM19056.1 hypothetical protein SAMD00019534_022310 [Acytostelium subglobosum LB1]|eukprot:XP_012756983.1 hypothetical protein SAMD00019534_022310 [Acytostelium subglobosum LB1]
MNPPEPNSISSTCSRGGTVKQLYYYSDYPDVLIPEDVSLTQYIMPYLERHGDRVLLVDGLTSQEYTACDVKSAIEKFASALSKLGFQKGDVVAFILPNSPQYVMAFHGALLVGCVPTAVSIDFQLPEILKTIGTVSPKGLVTIATNDKIADIQRDIPSIQHTIVIGDVDVPPPNTLSYSKLLATSTGEYPRVTVNGRDEVAFLPFSSGTTGMPKGVELTHCNLIANVVQIQSIECTTYKYNDVVFGVLPYFHIYGMVFFFGIMLKVGVKSVIVPRFEPNSYLKLIQTHMVTISFIAPPVAIFFAKSPLIDNYDLSSLRTLFCGAAPCSDNVENAIKQRFNGQVILKQAYGLTEASPAIVVTPYSLIKSGASGKILPNIVLKIQDHVTKELKEAGQSGEICIKGPNVMKGYYKNPKATQELFDQDGFLHTGDIGRIDPDGYLYLEDRVKELIKYKGFQVPPAELEGVLLRHESILDCAVMGVPDEEAGELPIAFVVLRPNSTTTEEHIHEWFNPQVAYYKKLRGGIRFIEQVPKSAAGKILRKDLRTKYIQSAL